MCEVGIEKGLVYSKYLSCFLGDIRILTQKGPSYPAAHSGVLSLTGVWGFRGLYSPMHIPVCTPIPSQSAPASGILPRNPSLSGLVSSCTPYGHLGALVPSGDKSHTWQLQLDPWAHLAR